MKILCLCHGGMVRSVAVAGVLKYDLNQDAIAAGVEKNSPETLTMLAGWADLILTVQDGLARHIPEIHRHKVIELGVGGDVWGYHPPPDLIGVVHLALGRTGVIDRVTKGQDTAP